ncbi:integrase core domain-containing protein [Micromonospora sp. HUAS LYJ1]|uniref:integrase core domain-containing protein n=1 Tax=Micromonospora sp. HUAS LYJ1 TaxID=3061626 RepID=UPI0034A048B0
MTHVGGAPPRCKNARHLARYASRAVAAACRVTGVRQSMSAVASAADKAAAESFNAPSSARPGKASGLKARLAAFRWLHRYNTVRRHSRLGHQSPITYEKNTRPASATLAPAASTPCPGSGFEPLVQGRMRMFAVSSPVGSRWSQCAE